MALIASVQEWTKTRVERERSALIFLANFEDGPPCQKCCVEVQPTRDRTNPTLRELNAAANTFGPRTSTQVRLSHTDQSPVSRVFPAP